MTLAGLSPAGALIVRAGEPFALQVGYVDENGALQDLTGRIFALAIRYTDQTQPFLTINAELDALATTAVALGTAAQASEIYAAGLARRLSYDFMELTGGATSSRLTERVAVEAGSDLPGDVVPQYMDLPVLSVTVAAQRKLAVERGRPGFGAERRLFDAGLIDEPTVQKMDARYLEAGAEGARPFAEAAEQSAGEAGLAKAGSEAEAARAKGEADRSSTQADRSEMAATTAQAAGKLYLDVEEGRLATAEGGEFYVQAQGDDEFALLYRVVNGLAVFTGKVTPSAPLVLATVEDGSEAAAGQINAASPSPDIDIQEVDGLGLAIVYYDRVRQGYVIQMVGDAAVDESGATIVNLPDAGGTIRPYFFDGAGKPVGFWDLLRQGFNFQLVTDEDDSHSAATALLLSSSDPNIRPIWGDGFGKALFWYDYLRGGYDGQFATDEDQSYANANVLNVVQSDPNKRISQTDAQGGAIIHYDLRQQGYVIQQVGDELVQEASAREIIAPPLADGKEPATVDYQGKLLTYRDIDGVEKSWAPSGAVEIIPPFVVEVRAGVINFYYQQGGPSSNIYSKRPFVRSTDTARNADVWHLWEAYETTRIGASTFVDGQKFVLVGEIEMAIYISGRADDHIGGSLHGNQRLTDTYARMNGARFDHTDPANYGFYTPDIFEFFQSSDLLLIGATEETKWASDNPKMADQWMHWTFGGPEQVRMRPITSFQASTLTSYNFDHAYFGMIPLVRKSGTLQITDRGAFSPMYFPVRDMTNSGFPSFSTTTGDGAAAWGPRYSGEFKALRGWGAGCDIYISRSSLPDYNKIYPSWSRATVAAGTIWDFEYAVTLRINTGA